MRKHSLKHNRVNFQSSKLIYIQILLTLHWPAKSPRESLTTENLQRQVKVLDVKDVGCLVENPIEIKIHFHKIIKVKCPSSTHRGSFLSVHQQGVSPGRRGNYTFTYRSQTKTWVCHSGQLSMQDVKLDFVPNNFAATVTYYIQDNQCALI